MPEAKASQYNQIFNDAFIPGHEEASSAAPRLYEISSAGVAIGREQPTHRSLAGVEIYGRTGNSTAIIAALRPDLAPLYVVNPSEPLREVAEYKLGREGITLPDGLSPEALAYIEEIKIKTTLFNRGRIILLPPSYAWDIPLKTGSVERIFGCQAFHWFAQDEQARAKSLPELARILKPGGRLIFDLSGTQISFGDAKLEGRKVDEMHVLQHPLYKKMLYSIQQTARQEGIEWPEPEEKPRKFMFSAESLTNILAEFGFEIVPTRDHKTYLLTVVHKGVESLRDTLKYGPVLWTDLNNTPFDQLTTVQKQAIADVAFQEVMRKHENLLAVPSVEAFAVFAFKKVR